MPLLPRSNRYRIGASGYARSPKRPEGMRGRSTAISSRVGASTSRASSYPMDSPVDRLPFLSEGDARLLSQIQGRTYAYIFGLVERFISTDARPGPGPRVRRSACARSAGALFRRRAQAPGAFRRMETMIGSQLPPGYRQVADPNDVAHAVLAASTWSVLALTCHIELFVQSHYAESIGQAGELCPCSGMSSGFTGRMKAGMSCWMNSSGRTNTRSSRRANGTRRWTNSLRWWRRVDGILRIRSESDSVYFVRNAARPFSDAETSSIRSCVLGAYRWQYIISGVRHRHFGRLLAEHDDSRQLSRIQTALAPIIGQ